MAKKFFDNVQHLISVAPGTGATLTFGSVPSGWQGLSSAGAVATDEVPYEYRDGTAWENGWLTIDSGGATGQRNVLKSSNSNARINGGSTGVFTVVLIADVVNTIVATKAYVDATFVPLAGGAMTGALSIQSTNASALAIGRQGATDPVLKVNASVGSVATGWELKGNAAAAGSDLTVTSSGTNESGRIDAKGTGTLTLQGTATGNLTTPRVTTLTNSTASTSTTNGALVVTGGVGIGGALSVGGVFRMGATMVNPVGALQVKQSSDHVNSGLQIERTGAAIDEMLRIGYYATPHDTWMINAGYLSAGASTYRPLSFLTSDIVQLKIDTVSGGTGVTVTPKLNISDVTEVGAGTGSFVTLGGAYVTKAAKINSGTAASSTTTGALTVAGGVGVGGAAYVGGVLRATDTTAASSASTGSGTFGGGLGVAGKGYFGGALNVLDTTDTTSETTGAGIIAGGLGVAKNLYVAGPMATLRGASPVLRLHNNAASGTARITFREGATDDWTIVNSIGESARLYVWDAGGDTGVFMDQNNTSWQSLSDRRLAYKQNARTLRGLLERINNFRLVEYGEGHGRIGVIAQEFIKFLPQLVGVGDDSDRIISGLTEIELDQRGRAVLDEDGKPNRVPTKGVWSIQAAESGFAALGLAQEIWNNLDARLAALESGLAN
jgi:hypothetical protein